MLGHSYIAIKGAFCVWGHVFASGAFPLEYTRRGVHQAIIVQGQDRFSKIPAGRVESSIEPGTSVICWLYSQSTSRTAQA